MFGTSAKERRAFCGQHPHLHMSRACAEILLPMIVMLGLRWRVDCADCQPSGGEGGGELFERAWSSPGHHHHVQHAVMTPGRHAREGVRPSCQFFSSSHADEQRDEALAKAPPLPGETSRTDDMRDAIQTVANGDAYVPSFLQPRPEIAR
jgi:hypothetical protein